MNWKFWKKMTDNNAAEDAWLKTFPGPDLRYVPDSVGRVTTLCQLPQQRCDENYIRISLCERCGACCAFFCVSFPGLETDETTGGVVPIAMTLPSKGSERFMKGTETMNPRCIALEGTVGSRVRCTIYANRPSICRSFSRSWENNIGNTLCDKARGAFGLQAFSQY